MRFFTRKRDVVLSKDVPDMSTIDRYVDEEVEHSQAKVSTERKQDKPDGTASKKKDKDSKKKKKKKSKRDKEKRKSFSSSSKLVDRVPTVESGDSGKTQDVHGESSQGDVHVSIASDDNGDDRYSVAGHLSRGGRSSAGVSVLSDDSDEFGARWRSWDDDDEAENRDCPLTEDEVGAKDGKKKKISKKKKKKHRSKSKDKSEKKKKKSKDKKSKSNRSDDSVRDQPDDHEKHSTTEVKQESTSILSDPLIQVLGATATDGQDHSLIEEVEIEHLFEIPAEMEEFNCVENPVESCHGEETVIVAHEKKIIFPCTRSIISDDTFEVDSGNGVVTTLMASRTTNNKELLELDEYSIHELENQSALGQCLRFYSCNGIARLLEFQPKPLPPVVKEDSSGLPTTSAHQNYELLLGVKSPVASDPTENILASGNSEDSLDLHEAPSLDMIKRNPSVVVDLTGKNLCLDEDESVEDTRSRKTGNGSRHRKQTPRNNHKVTITSIEIPGLKTRNISDKKPVNSSDKSIQSLPVDNNKAPKRGNWLQRRRPTSDDRSVHSERSAVSTIKKRGAQSFFLRLQGKRAQC